MKSCIAPMITLLQYQLNYVTPAQKKKKIEGEYTKYTKQESHCTC